MVKKFKNYIDGEWINSERNTTFKNLNPANVNDFIGEFQRSSKEDVEYAVEAASESREEWASTPPPKRGNILIDTAKILEKKKDELVKTLTREEGKTLSESAGEVQRAIDIFFYYGSKARDLGGEIKYGSTKNKKIFTQKNPIGVVGIITPWNYPIAIPTWKIAPALMTGNSVIFKPATLAPNISRKLVQSLIDAGIPDGVINYITGDGSEVGETIVSHSDVDAITFTGSLNIGEEVYKQSSKMGKRVQTEMGGKNPIIVTSSANLKDAVEMTANGAFGVTGQACTATSRAVVYDEVYDEFLENIIELADNIKVGPGLQDPDMGPQVSKEELDSTLDYIDIGLEEDAILEIGGNPLQSGIYSKGYFIEPTVFSDVEPDMRIAQEEIFGPVLSIIRVSDFEEAVKVANGVEYGLSASIVTNDHIEANRFIEEIQAGVIKVNEKTTGLELHVPFGGFKKSSSETWREQGNAVIDFYTISKTVYLNY
ncbi:MAG: aldehyde dehydrogenase family protein [Thermoplasmatota archaeon]